MLLDGEGVVAAALHGRIVGDDHGEPAGDLADAGDEAGGGDILSIDVVGGELADFEEGGARIEEALDALAREKLAAGDVAGAGGFGASEGDSGGAGAEIRDEVGHCGPVRV
jgi:hypothetical protein